MSKKQTSVNPQHENKNGFYFPALDGLRFFAFFIVFLHHALHFPSDDPTFVNNILQAIKKNGWVGVDLFFVLSGFLITTILLKERSKFGKFSFKNFYIRRALRIWPLYFLALITGFFIFPFLYQTFFGVNFNQPQYSEEIKNQLPLYFLFLGNWAVIQWSYSSFSNIAHLWTISVEEQFYLVWPLVLFFIRGFKSSVLVGATIVLFSLLTRYFLAINNTQHPDIYVNTFARVDILVLGAVLALIYYYPNKITSSNLLKKVSKYLFSLPILFIALSILGYILYRVSLFSPYLIRNGVFGYLIIGGFMLYFTTYALRQTSSFSHFLSWPTFVWLGKISYGLYIWHKFGIDISEYILKNTQLSFLIPITSFAITVSIGYLSYTFFESWFLKFKNKYTSIGSRPV